MTENKSETMVKVLNTVSNDMFGITRTEAKEKKVCVVCHQSVTTFTDSLSEQEYQISGMCQSCQDILFN